jgi:hypothetical protein
MSLALPKKETRLERLARDKHSSFLRKFVNYALKKFYKIGPRTDATVWNLSLFTQVFAKLFNYFNQKQETGVEP